MARARAEPPRRAKPPPRPERQVAFRLGLSAESRAAAYLIAKGYPHRGAALASPVGEIDIVARRRQLLVFVEVKARDRLDDAAEAVIARQQRRIIAAAEAWLADHPDADDSRHALRRVLVAPKAAAAHPGGVRRE